MSHRGPLRLPVLGLLLEVALLSLSLARKGHRTLGKDIRQIVPNLFFLPFISFWRLSLKGIAEPENG